MCADIGCPGKNMQWQGGEISKLAYCLKANNPTPMTYTGTNTWILSNPDSRDAYIVDPGPLIEEHLKTLESYVRDSNLNLRAILLTHMHIDHSEAAQEVAKRFSVKVYSRASGTLTDGEFSIEQGPKLKIISLPGHSSDSVGFCFKEDKSIVTGDAIFLQSPTAIVSPDGSLKDYFATLNLLRKLVEAEGYERFLTAHGWYIDDPLTTITNTEAHRLNRLARVRGAIARRGKLDIDYILENVYDDIDTRLDPAARMNVIAQIDYLKSIHDPCMPHSS